MTTPQDEARERAAEALDRVERTLAAPRPEGPLHTLTTGETFEEWHARVGTETPPAPPPRQAPRTAIGAMTDDQFAQMLGGALGNIRREVLAEVEAVAGLLTVLEARVAALEGRADG